MSVAGRHGRDQIRINDLSLIVFLLSGAQWVKSTPVEQPVLVTVSIFYDVSLAARTDDLTLSLDYSLVTKSIRRAIGNKSFNDLRDLSRQVTNTLGSTLVDVIEGLEVYVKVIQVKPPLHAKAVGIEHHAIFGLDRSWTPRQVTHFVEDLVCPAIIGVNAAERVEKQDVVVKLSIDTGKHGLNDDPSVDLCLVTKVLYEKINASRFQTLEALTSYVTSETLSHIPSYHPRPSVSARVAKPSALSLAGSSEVQLLRTSEDFSVDAVDQITPSQRTIQSLSNEMLPCPTQTKDLCTAVIALGSNLGDSFQNIEHALRLLEDPRAFNASDGSAEVVTVIDTSFLYETSPMYVEDQPCFVNGACIVETNMLPTSLLQLIKSIEQKVGRLPSIQNGPRAIDLDIIFYNNQVVDAEDVLGRKLIIPHARMQEREFVLRPLNDIIPDYVHPILRKTVGTLLHELTGTQRSTMDKLIPFPRPIHTAPQLPETQCHWLYGSGKPRSAETHKTQLMATVNVTPDSFSDGGIHDQLPTALRYISSSVAAGAAIIDIGGYSTRPGAAFVSVDDEINRVVPVIRATRNKDELMALKYGIESEEALEQHIEAIMKIPISIDTFRWEVAEAAIQAGANCINDVSAFTGQDSWSPASLGTETLHENTVNMKSIARMYGVPVVLMHSRGDAGSNKDYSSFSYAADEEGRGTVLEGVRVELGAKVNRVVRGKGGVRRWLVIVDPGIGFSKTLEGNLEVLRGAKSVVADVNIGHVPLYKNPLRGFPMLIAASRKSFLGQILEQHPVPRKTEAKDRAFATAATVSFAIRQDAMIVRVHDVQEMMDVVKVTEALLY